MGEDNEEPACIVYKKHMQGNGHRSLRTKKAGFVVDIEKSWLGVFPDAWVHDSSVECMYGIAEFKRPYTMADKTPEKMCDQKGFYLVSHDGIPCLKQTPKYYQQVQLQLYVTKSIAKWCDFRVYSLKCVFVISRQVLAKMLCRRWTFFMHISPELINPCKPSYYL